MDDWENFQETSLPEKADFYNHLNMEDIRMQIADREKEFVKILK